MTTTRRVYFYAVALVTLAVWSWGVGLLIRLIFDLIGLRPSISGTSNYFWQQFSLGVALLAIALPIWLFHWMAIQKYTTTDKRESAAPVRKAYLSLLMTATAITILRACYEPPVSKGAAR
ncbi:MAG: hypothetical protein HYX87_08370 [Chloroflexi bacterium]|nr:hypothetical protein [Chloroflexota bacterium]